MGGELGGPALPGVSWLAPHLPAHHAPWVIPGERLGKTRLQENNWVSVPVIKDGYFTSTQGREVTGTKEGQRNGSHPGLPTALGCLAGRKDRSTAAQ